MFTLKMSIGKSKEPIGRSSILTPIQVYNLCKELGELNQETFAVICLNTNKKVISKNIITIGVVNQTLVHPREVFRVAIQDGASFIIIVHNHPSGEVTPSSNDITLTKQILEAAKLLSIPILDHVIIGKKQVDYGEGETEAFYSFQEKGLCDFSMRDEALRAAE
jgi:DNA repair protein RadC